MCFSAQASFTAAAFIGTIGVVTIARAKKPMRALAITPLFFALQQALEGIVWLTMDVGDSTSLLHKASMYTFLVFATMIWPVHINYAFGVESLTYLPPSIVQLVFYTVFFLYLLPTIGSFFISTLRWAWVFGVVVAVGWVVSVISFSMAVGSVWCFFGALASIITYVIVTQDADKAS